MLEQSRQLYHMAENYKPTIENGSSWADWEQALRDPLGPPGGNARRRCHVLPFTCLTPSVVGKLTHRFLSQTCALWGQSVSPSCKMQNFVVIFRLMQNRHA
jgi:hypothetical protein